MTHSLPNLHHLKVDQCLAPDLQPKTVKANAKLRGSDAIFWPANKSEDALTTMARCCYPHDEYLEYEDDFENATINYDKIHNNVQPTTLPMRDQDQLLYHWTNNFPSDAILKKEELLETKGYVWTSTFEGFVWNRYDRVTIVIPSDTSLQVYIDPQSHSHTYLCEGEAANSMRTHKDVVLPPSVFVLESIDGSAEERQKVSWSVLQLFVKEQVAENMPITVSASADGEKWILTTDTLQNRDALYVMLKHPIGNSRVRKQEAVQLFSQAVETEANYLVIHLERLQIRLPVIRWVRTGSRHGS